MYDCLPMYHTAGGLCAIGSLLVARRLGLSSASAFRRANSGTTSSRNDCTLMQYIGELCRYLVNSPPHPNETKHKLRLACGNGLRPDIWDEFKTRFQIPLILEFYAATEGNVHDVQFRGQARRDRPPALVSSSIASRPRWCASTSRHEQPVRNAEGFCIACDPDEIGEAIGKIVNDAEKARQPFRGLCAPAKKPTRKSCAMCSSRTTSGFAPAT